MTIKAPDLSPHPLAQAIRDIDGFIHVVDIMGFPWCEQSIELDGDDVRDHFTVHDIWCESCCTAVLEDDD